MYHRLHCLVVFRTDTRTSLPHESTVTPYSARFKKKTEKFITVLAEIPSILLFFDRTQSELLQYYKKTPNEEDTSGVLLV